MKLCLQMLNYSYTKEGSLYWNYGTEGVSWEYDDQGVPAFTSLVTDDKDTDPMTKYNGLTWGGSRNSGYEPAVSEEQRGGD